MKRFSGELLAERILFMEKESFGKLPAARKRDILGKAVREIVWDGENAKVHLQAEEMPEGQPAK